MLRYNNQVGFSKPVDYFRPLTVDVSVEYELPKEVAPPPGSAPLLIIHPSAYYRTNKSSSNRSNPQGVLSPKPGKVSSEASSSSLSSSTYFLRSTTANGGGNGPMGGLALRNQHSIYSKSSSNQNPATSSTTSKSTRYSGNGIMSSSSISRSRSMTMGNNSGDSRGGGSGSISMNCPYGKCDECASVGSGGCGSSSSSARVTNGVKKLGFHRQAQQDGGESFNYYNNLHQSTSTGTSAGMNIGTSNASGSKNHQLLHLQQHHQQPSIISGSGNHPSNGIRTSGSNIISSSSINGNTNTSTSANPMIDCVGGSGNNSRTSTSNKRLRMMSQQQNMLNNSQQQQQLQQQQNQLQQASHHHQLSLGLAVVPEPLNLAVAPSASNHLHLQHLSPSSIYLNQRSALYKQHQQLHSQQQLQQQLQQQQSLQQGSGNNRNSLHLSNNNGMSGSGGGGNNVSNGNNGPANNPNNIQMINYGYRGSNLTALSNLYATTSNQTTANVTAAVQASRFLKDCPIPVDKGSGSDSGVCSENDSDGISPPMAPYHSNSNNLRRSILSQELPSSGCYCCCCPTTSDNSSSSATGRKSVGGKVKNSSSVSKSGNRNVSNNSSMTTTAYSSGGSAYASMVIQESQLGNMLISCDSPMASGNSPMDSSSSPATYRKWFVGDTATPSQLGRWFQV